MRRTFLAALILAALLLLPAASAGDTTLRSSFAAADGKRVFDALLANADIKAAADRVAPFHLRIALGDGGSFDYDYANGALSDASAASPDYTLTTTRDIALGVLNADEGFHILACALNENAATITASNVAYAAALNAAKGRIAGTVSDCHVYDGASVRFRGASGTIQDGSESKLPRYVARMGDSGADFLAFNTWGAPTAWIPAASTHLCNPPAADNSRFGMWFTSDPCRNIGSALHARLDDSDCRLQTISPGIGFGWDAGRRAAQAVSDAAERGACGFLYKGVR